MSLRILVIVFTLGLVACAEPPDAFLLAQDPVNADDGRYGLVILEHHFGDPGVAVTGQFLAYHRHDRDWALRSVLLPEQAWLTTDADLQCQVIPKLAGDEAPHGWIDLLGVGTLRVSTADGVSVVVPGRDYPPISFSISGVVYDLPAGSALPFQAGAQYRVATLDEAPGGVGGQVDAPTAVRWIRHRLTDEGLDLQWSGADDATIVISPHEGEAMGVVCNAQGNETRVPTAVLTALGEGPVRVTIANVIRRPLTVSGLYEAELVFVTRDTFELSMASTRNE
jgi:hypothetical protein